MKQSTISILLMIVVASASSLTVGCVDEGATCDAGELASRLRGAFRGDTVRMGECRIVGDFTVPEGVSLHGSGLSLSVIAATSSDVPALRVEGGERAAEVHDLAIESDGPAGVLVTGGGAAILENVTITATRGIALGVEALDTISLDNVTLSGPVTEGNAQEVSLDPTPDRTATHGLVLVRVGDADLRDVSAAGFARFGVLFVESATAWQRGNASENLATGLMIHAGSALLEDIVLCGTLDGFSLIPAYAGVFTAGAVVETHNVTVCDGQGIGLLHDHAEVDHHGLEVSGNEDAALWAQFCPSLSISEGSAIRDNGLAGVVMLETELANIEETSFEAMTLRQRVSGETGLVWVGDGMHVIDPAGPVSLSKVTFDGNERVGLLLSAEAGTDLDLSFDHVEVTGSGDQLGAIGQGRGVTTDWDLGISRAGDTVGNDERFSGVLETLEPVATDDMPSGDSALMDIEDLFGR